MPPRQPNIGSQLQAPRHPRRPATVASSPSSGPANLVSQASLRRVVLSLLRLFDLHHRDSGLLAKPNARHHDARIRWPRLTCQTFLVLWSPMSNADILTAFSASSPVGDNPLPAPAGSRLKLRCEENRYGASDMRPSSVCVTSGESGAELLTRSFV
jgi:hypothetical protein